MGPPFASAEDCEAAFYAAFEACDLDAMMAVWAEGTPLLCIHPARPALTGRAAIAESWRQIFAGGGGMRFTLSDLQQVTSAELAVRYVHENIHHGPELRSTALVLATNVFVREGRGWKLCSHHASPAPAPSPADAPDPRSVH